MAEALELSLWAGDCFYLWANALQSTVISFHSLHDPLMLSLEIVTVVRHLCPGLLFPFENKYGFLEFSILFFKEQWLGPKHQKLEAECLRS